MAAFNRKLIGKEHPWMSHLTLRWTLSTAGYQINEDVKNENQCLVSYIFQAFQMTW